MKWNNFLVPVLSTGHKWVVLLVENPSTIKKGQITQPNAV